MRTSPVPANVRGAKRIAYCNVIELQAGAGSSTIYRWTNHVQPIVVDMTSAERALGPVSGAAFAQQYFEVGGISTSGDEAQTGSVVFADQNQVVRAIVWSGNFSRWRVNVYEVYLDADHNPIYIDLMIAGFVDGVRVDDPSGDLGSQVEMGITTSETPESGPAPRRPFSHDCTHRYKDIYCAATSPLPDCEHTLEACGVRNNLANFGGFPFAPVEGAKFMWGPKSTTTKLRPVWRSSEG